MKVHRENPDSAVWEASKEIACAVAEATTAEEMGQVILDALGRLVGCDFASILTAEPGQEWSIAGQISDNRLLQQHFWRYSAEMSATEAQGLAGRFASASDVFDAPRRDRLAIFREVLTPRRLDHVAAAHWVVDGRLWAVGLSREGPCISDQTLKQLNAVLPHLKAALRARFWLARDQWSPSSDQIEPYARAGSGGPWGLTPAQGRTLALVIRGLTNKEVAGLLGTSPHTVRNTVAELFRKVGVSRRSELAFIVRSGAVESGPRCARAALSRQRAFLGSVEQGMSGSGSGADQYIGSSASRRFAAWSSNSGKRGIRGGTGQSR